MHGRKISTWFTVTRASNKLHMYSTQTKQDWNEKEKTFIFCFFVCSCFVIICLFFIFYSFWGSICLVFDFRFCLLVCLSVCSFVLFVCLFVCLFLCFFVRLIDWLIDFLCIFDILFCLCLWVYCCCCVCCSAFFFFFLLFVGVLLYFVLFCFVCLVACLLGCVCVCGVIARKLTSTSNINITRTTHVEVHEPKKMQVQRPRERLFFEIFCEKFTYPGGIPGDIAPSGWDERLAVTAVTVII